MSYVGPVQGDGSCADSDIMTSALHADDFQLITPVGRPFSKEQYLGAIASGDLDYLVWEPGPIDVLVADQMVALRYQAQLEVVGFGEKRPLRSVWHTDVYERRDDRNGANLFGLCFGVDIESGLVCWQQHLERVDAVGVGRDRDNCDHAATEASCGGVRPVVAHHDSGTRSGCFAADDGVKVDEADLPAAHQLSATVLSHASFAESSAHSVNAAA